MPTQRKQSRSCSRWSAVSSTRALRTPQSVVGLVYAVCVFATGTLAAEAGVAAALLENTTTSTPATEPPAVVSPAPSSTSVPSPPPSSSPEPTTLAPIPTKATPMESPTTQPPVATTAPPTTTSPPTPTATPAPVVTPSPSPTPTMASPPSSSPTPPLSPAPTSTPNATPNTDKPSPTPTQAPASSIVTTSSPAPSSTAATTSPSPATNTPQSSTTDAPAPASAPEPTNAPSKSSSVSPSPQTTATPAQSLVAQQSQSTSTLSPTASDEDNKETVTLYNSTTLPPSINASVLDGGELVNVETKATTRNGQTSVTYTIVVKKGDVVEKVQQPGFNTSDPTAVILPSPSDITSSTTDIDAVRNSTSVTSSTVNSRGLSSGVIVGLVLGALVIGLLISGFVMKRRHRKKSVTITSSSTKSSARTVEEGYSSLETIRMDYRDTVMNNTRHLSYESDMRPSSRRRSSGSIWEDAVIVAARIPFDKVQIGKLLNRGGFGEVYQGTYREQVVAIKKLLPETRKDLQHIESFLGEIKLQASLDHPHIVTFLGVAWESLSDLYALSEFMERGDLRSLLVKYNEPGSSTPQGFSYEKVKIALQIAHALTYLHSLQPQLLHRDLKSRNILLTSKLDAKLTDFGSSRVCATSHDVTMTAGVGSSLWMAPEVMVGKRYDEKSDVFSLGIVLSELDTHELPYSHRKESTTGGGQIVSTSKSRNSDTSGAGGRLLPETAILQMVSMGKLQVQFSKNCPPEMVALAHKCISVDPHERPTAAEVLYQLHVVLRLFETM